MHVIHCISLTQFKVPTFTNSAVSSKISISSHYKRWCGVINNPMCQTSVTEYTTLHWIEGLYPLSIDPIAL